MLAETWRILIPERHGGHDQDTCAGDDWGTALQDEHACGNPSVLMQALQLCRKDDLITKQRAAWSRQMWVWGMRCFTSKQHHCHLPACSLVQTAGVAGGHATSFPLPVHMSVAAGCELKEAIGVKFSNVKYFDLSPLKLCQLWVGELTQGGCFFLWRNHYNL